MPLLNKLKFFKVLPPSILFLILVSCVSAVHRNNEDAIYVYQNMETKLYGFKNAQGNTVIQAQYDYVYVGDYIDDRPVFMKD